jgi:hypothetical protein
MRRLAEAEGHRVLAIATVAGLGPALRATRVDSIVALRCE